MKAYIANSLMSEARNCPYIDSNARMELFASHVPHSLVRNCLSAGLRKNHRIVTNETTINHQSLRASKSSSRVFLIKGRMGKTPSSRAVKGNQRVLIKVGHLCSDGVPQSLLVVRKSLFFFQILQLSWGSAV